MEPSFVTPSTYPQPGDLLDGKYRVEHLLGEGGMGAVARATHILRRAPVALKFMSPAVLSLQGAVERFVNEGVAASQIDSDHVVKIFDVGRLPSGAPYLVMELLDGCDLGQLLEREGPTLPLARAVHFTVQALRALQTAHAAGIIHRDMKPSNCFVVEKDGEPDFVKLVDFGISKVRSTEEGAQVSHLTRTNSALGTPLYMSPEQARSPRDVDHRTDLYSVGAILYEMLTGRTPYTADSGEYTEILFKIFTTEPDPIGMLRPDLPEGLAAVVHRALDRDKNTRFGSAAEFAEALAPFADDRTAQVLARLRGGRGSRIPGGNHSVIPAAHTTRATQQEATARTHVSDGAVGLRPQLASASTPATDVGVTRETPSTLPAAGHRPGTGIVIAIAVAIAVASAIGTVILTRSHATVADAPPAPAALPPPATEQATALTPTAAPTAALTPTAETLSTTSPSASASSKGAIKPAPRASAATVPQATPSPTSPSQAPLPTQLGDLKLH